MFRNLLILILIGILLLSCITTEAVKTTEAAKYEKVIAEYIDENPLPILSAIQNLDIQQVLSETNLNQTNAFGDTPLMVAAASGSPGICAYLLSRGADPNATNQFGESALHFACQNGFFDLASFLKAAGADPDRKDVFGVSPQDLAGGAWNVYTQAKISPEQFTGYEKLYGSEIAIGLYDGALQGLPNRQRNEEWMAFISRASVSGLENWLSMKDCHFPDAIPEPELPSVIVLKQDDWEMNDEFETRVKQAQQKRQEEIEAIQEKYRQAVEGRNRTILNLENIQKARIAVVEDYKPGFVQYVLNSALGNVTMKDPSIDKNTGDIFLDVFSSQDDNLGSFLFSASGDVDFRKAVFQDLSSLEFAPVPKVNGDGSFSLDQGQITYNGKIYTARLTSDSAAIQKAMTATIELTTGTESLTMSQLQNPNLVDRNAVGEITYKDGTQKLLDFNDDLAPLIADVAPVPRKGDQWAFVIGAEKYLNTDDILYARRSAELFVQALVKVKGVPEGHIITMMDEEATSGNIKTKLQKLLEQGISQGDTLYFYYNGHGIPAVSDQNEPYMLPTDMIQDYITAEPFFKLSNIYKMLEDSKAGKVLVFMDSCFTGTTDGVSVFKGMAATRLAPKKTSVDSAGSIAILTAGKSNQFSSAWPEKGYRLFTYYLIKAFLEGADSVEDLYSSVSSEVSATSREIGGINTLQDPTVSGNVNLRF